MARPSQLLLQKFPFQPTQGQLRLFALVDEFLEKKGEKPAVLVLRGYAGTGKTTLVSALVKVLPDFDYKSMLLAPTGRAAKVMSGYSGRAAFTVHKIIYKSGAEEGSGHLSFQMQKNYSKQTVFLVDEASMLSEEASFGKRGLLTDLFGFVFQHPSNKLILIGDGAQLPPVGQEQSPALDVSYLQRTFRAEILSCELTEVMRQEQDSGILVNATALRMLLAQSPPVIKFETGRFRDIFKMNGSRMEDGLRYAYDKFGVEHTIVICRSNKNAVMYNQYIRRAIRFAEDELEAGDVLMVVKNNYALTNEEIPGGFLANGDFVEVQKIISFEEMYGFRFATVRLGLVDYPETESFETKIILDTLHTSTPALSPEQNRDLYSKVLEDYQDLALTKERNGALRKDPYLQALQVKFAYALTCHKAQGGQWKAVFVDQGYLKDEPLETGFVRWLYTAITRASEELYLVNFHSRFFVGQNVNGQDS
jgi:ATP-dependent exoDNAse (exonuclease V) alpha subunit